jgi:hypothetical protein
LYGCSLVHEIFGAVQHLRGVNDHFLGEILEVDKNAYLSSKEGVAASSSHIKKTPEHMNKTKNLINPIGI